MKDFSKCDFTIQNQTTLDSADASVYALIDLVGGAVNNTRDNNNNSMII